MHKLIPKTGFEVAGLTGPASGSNKLKASALLEFGRSASPSPQGPPTEPELLITNLEVTQLVSNLTLLSAPLPGRVRRKPPGQWRVRRFGSPGFHRSTGISADINEDCIGGF